MSRRFLSNNSSFASRVSPVIPNTQYTAQALIVRNNVTNITPKLAGVVARVSTLETKVDEVKTTTDAVDAVVFRKVAGQRVSNIPTNLATRINQIENVTVNANLAQRLNQIESVTINSPVFTNSFVISVLKSYFIYKATFETLSVPSQTFVSLIMDPNFNPLNSSNSGGDYFTVGSSNPNDPNRTASRPFSQYVSFGLNNQNLPAVYLIKPKWTVDVFEDPVIGTFSNPISIPQNFRPYSFSYEVKINVYYSSSLDYTPSVSRPGLQLIGRNLNAFSVTNNIVNLSGTPSATMIDELLLNVVNPVVTNPPEKLLSLTKVFANLSDTFNPAIGIYNNNPLTDVNNNSIPDITILRGTIEITPVFN